MRSDRCAQEKVYDTASVDSGRCFFVCIIRQNRRGMAMAAAIKSAVKDLSLTMVADHIGMSKNYFSKIFKESMGENFVNYVTRLRMEYARELYLGSDRKIYEIAEMVGYSDWHYFYNFYRKTFGHSLSYEKSGRVSGQKGKK